MKNHKAAKMDDHKSVSACVFSQTGVDLFKLIIQKSIQVDTVYLSDSESPNIIREMQAIALESKIKMIILSKEQAIGTLVDKSFCTVTSYLLLLWWPFILKKNCIDKFNYVINIHPSFLPFGRGKYGYFWSLMYDEPFGASIHLVDEGIDSGQLLAQQEIFISPTDTGGDLYQKGVEACISLFDSNITTLLKPGGIASMSNSFKHTKSHGSYRDKRDFADYCAEQEKKLFLIDNAIDYLRARTFLDGRSYRYKRGNKIFDCSIIIKEVDE